jgi:hypothetical protein
MADPYDPNMDWVPAPISPADEFVTVDTSFGPMEKWKARALAIGWFQRQVQTVRDDSIGLATTPLPDEHKPPPLAADEDEPARSALSEEELAEIEDAVDRLDARLTMLERRRAAEAALETLEDEVERLTPSDECADGIKLN